MTRNGAEARSIGLDFNSHAHVERDEQRQMYDRKILNFNSHAHVERDVKSKFSGICTLDFNSHAHVERDIKIFKFSCGFYISTHTLTWSVTGMSIKF